MIKFIACDMDGTLLQTNQIISKRTIKAIHKIQEQGIEFILATGRDRVMGGEVLKQFDIHCDMMLNNGNEYLSKDGSQHIFIPMDHNVLKQICELLIAYDYHASLYSTNGKYTFLDLDDYYQRHINMVIQHHGELSQELKNSVLFQKEYFLKHTHQIHSIEELFENGIDVLKIDAKHWDMEKSSECLNQILKMPHLDISSSYNDNFEICADTSNKGRMLERICAQKGYQKEEVLVLGDSHNDISMFQMFPHSVAPANACEEIKNIASYITSDNNHDGVAHVLEALLKKKEGLS